MEWKNTVIDDRFVDSLFQHPNFQHRLHQSWKQHQYPAKDPCNDELTRLVEEISSIMVVDLEFIYHKTQSDMRRELQSFAQEIDKLKDMQISKADFSSKENTEETMLDDEQLFDLPSIKRTICSLQEKVREISLNSSVILDSSEFVREAKFKEDTIQEKITTEMAKVQLHLAQQHETLEETLNKKLEKQQKTINNILETLNDLHPTGKVDRTMNTLTMSRSGKNLKSFFGFS